MAPGLYSEDILDLKSDAWALDQLDQFGDDPWLQERIPGYVFGSTWVEFGKGLSQAIGFTPRDLAQPLTKPPLTLILVLVGIGGIWFALRRSKGAR